MRIRPFKDLERPQNIEAIREHAMTIMEFCFTKSQENLTTNMPWGDENRPSDRKPTTITDTGALLISGIPPYWESDTIVAFEYPDPRAGWVEYGTLPHPINPQVLVPWVGRRLGKTGQEQIRIAYAIANRIRKEGIPPHPFIRPAVESTRRKYGLQLITEPKP